MMPVYRYLDSNPHQRNQAPLQQHFFPGFEAVPPHFKVDPSKSPMMYESWPYSSNYGYPAPYHGCCNHGNFPGYYSFRPPCPHFAPSLAFHHYPNYPAFPEAYPVYHVPPPHYSKEQPRYEYDKDSYTNYHCCVCPNHSHNLKNDRGLKVEEQDPDAEKKECDSVVPTQPRSSTFPIVWIPPEYIKNKEDGKRNNQLEVSDLDKAPRFVKPTEEEPNYYPVVWIPPEYMKNEEYWKHNDQPEVSDWDNAPRFVKPSKSSKPTDQQSRVWNCWFPFDTNGLKSLMQGEGEKKSQNQQNEDKMTQFPFPIFWVPSVGKKEDENQDKRGMITSSDDSKQAPGFEFIPVEPSVNDVRMDKPQSNKEISPNENASETMGKTANQKRVPVKQMEVHWEDNSEGTEKRGRDVSVKRIEDTAKNEVGGTNAKRKSLSPPKTSNLPPVCLRVDPLPKKRNGNGSSRSPSPPKRQSEDTSTKASTAPGLKQDFAVNTQNPNGSLDKVEAGEKKRKDIQVIEKISMENKAGESIDSQKVLGTPTIERTEKDSHESKTEEDKKASSEELMGDEKAAYGQCKAEIRRMSDAEAAKLIQSAYRGFEVRKWEPLKKLKQIAKVREQLDEIRNRIQALESSSDHNIDDRQRLLIGEMIMSLLLKLDTIQGLHSSVRDTRKSLVRELLTLQEKLDSLTSKKSEEKAKELATAESANCPSIEKESKKATPICISSFEDTNEKGNDIKEPDQEYVTRMVDEKSSVKDEKSSVKDEETTEPLIVGQGLDGKIENETTEVTCDIECPTAPRIQDGDVSTHLEHITDLSSVPKQKPNADEYVEANNLTREEKPGAVEVNDLILVNSNTEEDKLWLLPKEITNHVDLVSELEKEIENSNGEKESDMPINPALQAEVENLKCTEKDQEIDLLEELPVGIIDEEPAISEFEKSDMHETGKSNPLKIEDCLAEPQLEGQLLEATSGNCVKGQKENEFTNNPELELEVEQTHEKKVNNDKFESVFKQEEAPSPVDEENNDIVHEEEGDDGAIPVDHIASTESEAGSIATQEKEDNNDNKFESVLKPEEVPSPVGEESNDKVHEEEDHYGAIPVDQMASSESEAGSVATQEKEVLFEEKKEVQQPVGTEENEETKLENEIEVQKQECMNSEEKITNMPHETAEDRVLVAPNVEQKLIPASPAASRLSNEEHDLTKIEGDNKLIEENKKLREMMEKLMEAGKDQLTLISNLTGRVKEMEEKLSRNKKLSKPRYRKARYAPSHSKPVKAKGNAVEVAM